MTDYEKLATQLLEALDRAQDHLEYCNWGDSYERECAIGSGLPKMIEDAIAQAKKDLK